MAPSQAKKKVGELIHQHPFLAVCRLSFTTSQRRAFLRDVYDYARALGMSPAQARKQVDRTRDICGKEQRSADDSSWEGEVNDSEAICELLRKTARVDVKRGHLDEESRPQSTSSQRGDRGGDELEVPEVTPAKGQELRAQKIRKRKRNNDDVTRSPDRTPENPPRRSRGHSPEKDPAMKMHSEGEEQGERGELDGLMCVC